MPFPRSRRPLSSAFALLLAGITPPTHALAADTADGQGKASFHVGVSAVQPVVESIRNATFSAEPMAVAIDLRADTDTALYLGASLYVGTGGDRFTPTAETEVTRGVVLRVGLQKEVVPRLTVYGWAGIANYFEVETRPFGGVKSKGKGTSLVPWGVGLRLRLDERLEFDGGWSELYADGMELGGGTAIGGDIDIRGPHAGVAWAWR